VTVSFSNGLGGGRALRTLQLDLRGNRILSCGATVLAVLLTKLQQLLVLNLEATDLGLGGEPTMMGRGEHA